MSFPTSFKNYCIDNLSLDHLLDNILNLQDDHPFEFFLLEDNNISTMLELLDFINNNDDIIFNNCA